MSHLLLNPLANSTVLILNCQKRKKNTFEKSSAVGHIFPEHLCPLPQQVRPEGLSSSPRETFPGVSPNLFFFLCITSGEEKQSLRSYTSTSRFMGYAWKTCSTHPYPTLSRREPPQFCTFLNSRPLSCFPSGPPF